MQLRKALPNYFKLRDLRGNFDPKKALPLGVPRGAKFGMLQKGETVTVDDGTEVRSEQVLSPATLGPPFLIIACPSKDHISNLGLSTALQLMQLPLKTKENEFSPRVCVIYHLAPLAVLTDALYRQWCNLFGAYVTHFPLDSSMSCKQTVFASQAEDMALLHFALDKELYPLPQD